MNIRRGSAWGAGCLVLAMLGCSAESAVVGGDVGPEGGAGQLGAEQGVGRVTRTITAISYSEPNGEPARCLASKLPLDTDGTAACKLFVTSPEPSSCDCSAPNRAPVTDEIRDVVRAQSKAQATCDSDQRPACADLCVCEDLEASGDDLASCLAGNGESNGWCYVSPGQGLGQLTTTTCVESSYPAIVRLEGSGKFTAEEQGYLACSEVSNGVEEKRPLGAVCVPSDELNPNFRHFYLGEVVVDQSSTSCASGTCLVENFQGRVSCPFGSDTLGGGEGACVVPTTNERVVVRVASQLVSRPPSLAATCSCRCAGPGPGPFCTCAEGQECAALVADLGLPGDRVAGSYCVPAGAVSDGALTSSSDISHVTCADKPEECGDRTF